MSEDLEEECRASVLHDNIDLARLMVQEQQVDESCRRKKDRECKKSRSSVQFSLSNYNNSFGVRDRPKFKKGHKRSCNATLSKNTYTKEGNDRNAQRDRKPCDKCGCFHGGECLVGTNNLYGCSKSEHMVRDCPQMWNQARTDAQPRPNPTGAAEPPKRNKFYVLKGRE